MKVTVKEIFQDKYTGEHHLVGDVINIDDTARVEDLVKRNLVEAEVAVAKVAEPKKTATRKGK